MTFGAIDRERFTYILDLGTDAFELRNFFEDCRVQLIQRGAKVQNLPHGDKARIRAIVRDFLPGADDVLRTWFRENVTMSDPEAPDSIVETYRLHEEVGELIEETLSRKLARSCLVHLFADKPSDAILEFLRSPIGGVKEGKSDVVPQPPHPPAKATVQWDRFAELFLGLQQGQDLDNLLEGLPSDVAAMLTALQAATSGRTSKAQEMLKELAPDSRVRALLEQYLRQQAARPSREAPKGITVLPIEVSDGAFEYEQDEILGYCTKSDPPKSVFVQPVAAIRAGVVQKLSAESRRKLFPVNGDVMAFAGGAFPRQPRHGEMGVWKVSEHQTDKATHFHLALESRRIWEIFGVPFSSTDYDSVREFLRAHGEEQTGAMQQPLFALSDGLIVAARPEKADLTKEDAYEAGLLFWNELPVLRLEGRLFVLGPLPNEQGIYECASIATSVRRLLRPLIGAGKGLAGITKGQVSELVHYIESGSSDLSAQRIQRVRAELSAIDQRQDALQALIQELFLHPTIKLRVDELVQEAANKLAGEKTQLQNDIARLKKEREEWEQKIQVERDQHKKLRDNTLKVVKAAFEKARSDGIGTLAELAIFQELGGKERPLSIGANATIKEFAKAPGDAVGLLAEFGVGNRKAHAFDALAKAAFAVGLVLCVKGVAARIVVERWAHLVGRGVLLDTPIGFIDDAVLGAVFKGGGSPEVLAILDANLSAIDIYGRSVTDALVGRLSKRGSIMKTAVMMSLSDSVGHLPVPSTIEQLSVLVNLDRQYDFAREDAEELRRLAFDPSEGVVAAKLWAKACSDLQAHIESLDPETQCLILSVLVAAP